MQLSQALVERAVSVYNQVTRSHKRPIVVKYIEKQLLAGETAELPVATRWTSTLQFSGSENDVHIAFLINPCVPASFRNALERMKEDFDRLFNE